MMIHAYNEFYLNDAKQNLAECFDYAVNVCKMEVHFFSKIFIQSGYADKFERGNPAIIAGMSGIELAQNIILYAFPNQIFPRPTLSEERSDIYWAGWALAEYQWITKKRFKDIFSRISLTEIISMYNVYHEMDIEHFIDDLNKKFNSIEQKTRLKTIRENRGISQAELARLSGVSLRSIQMYEQRNKNINKASVDTIYRLAKVLGCTIEDLIER